MATAHPSLSSFSSGCQLLSAILVWLLLLLPVDAQNRRDEVRALLSFKSEAYSSSYSGYGYVNYWSTWKESDGNPCQWVGVICTGNLTVSVLDLSGWGLKEPDDGPINLAMLSSLKDLRELHLAANLLESMPDGIGSLTGLTRLFLSSNVMSGRIPQSISSCRNLRSLHLESNTLEGDVASLSALKNLQMLYLAGNQFSGPFPKELGELKHLVTLDLSYNLLNGTIPALPHASSLVDLALYNNNFSGFEEDWHLGSGGANSSLQRFDVSYNQLQGMIPQGLTNLLNLQQLGMSANRLSGSIPFGFSKLLNMQSMDFSQNQLRGDIPDDFLVQQSDNQHRCDSSIDLSQNLLTGSIPIDGAKFFCFMILDLSYNNLSGPIPPSIFDHDGNVRIVSLLVQHNNLSGDIVDLMVRNQGPGNWSTSTLRLQNNRFIGDLSRVGNMSFEKFPQLSELDLSSNDLRWSTSELMPDPIQATLERVTATGTRMNFTVAGNDFSGTSLPKTCFVNQSSWGFVQLNLSNCQLKGEILGAAFGSSCLRILTSLDLSNNDITGPVPNSILMLPNLEVLDVSNNHLFGALPAVPQNSSLSSIATFFDGNPGLCGTPLPPCHLHGSGTPWWVRFLTISQFVTIALLSCLATTRRWRVYIPHMAPARGRFD